MPTATEFAFLSNSFCRQKEYNTPFERNTPFRSIELVWRIYYTTVFSFWKNEYDKPVKNLRRNAVRQILQHFL